jgi:hypothetical protein
MHPHFAFTTVEVIWTLTFAAQLVLLVVLLGRERMQRFPWFTASIAAVALRLLAGRLLTGRLHDRLTLAAIMIPLADLGVVMSLGVLVEISRKAFRGVRRSTWIAGSIAMLAVGAVVLKYWGDWPTWRTMTADSKIALLLFLQLAGQKGELLVAVLTIPVGVLVALFGRRHGAGWRSHAQRIMIGLSTTAIAQLGVQAILQVMVKQTLPRTRPEADHMYSVADKFVNANSAVYIAVLVWWIACMWKDDPSAPKTAAAPAIPEPAPAAIPASEPAEPPAAAADGSEDSG